ncbi:MAG: hypothetical protein NC120_01310 [Ruminococcus sp.]|nr:hypothetical protein [Ruminococcus sp.]
MKRSRLLGGITAAALAALNMTAFAALPVSAEDVDLNGTYHAYIGIQTASYTFRNAYDDATYGYGVTADDGTVWFDQLTGWDGPTALNKGGSFVDAEIAGNGTYSVSVTDFDFGDDETLNLLFVSSDIPLNDTVKISDVHVVLDGQDKYVFDEAYMDPDAEEYMKWLAINIWNDDLGKADGLFGYIMPEDSVELQFTVSGFDYDNSGAASSEEEGGSDAGDGSFDPDGEYNAYIGVQSASYTFRNAYDDAAYGYGVTADDGTVWFDQLTGWDGPTALNKGGKFTDAKIAGNGTYSVSVTDFDFGDDETFNLLFVSSDIPLNDTLKITDVEVILDGQSKYVFDEAFLDPDAEVYTKWLAINIWNEDLGKAEGLFGYIMPEDSIELKFTVSGFNYDNENAAADADEPEEDTPEEAADVPDEGADDASSEEETTAAAEETPAETQAASASAPAAESSSNGGVIAIVVIAVIVVAVVVVVVVKKKS